MDSRDLIQQRVRRILLQRLESLSRAGVVQLARSQQPAVAAPLSADTPAPTPASPQPERETVARKTTPPKQDPRSELAVLQQEVATCTRCPELAPTRTQTVFGVGDPHSRLCFMGEAPGADEDRQGEPFVGRAGQLLTDIIQKGMGIPREEVYILNVLKCRPPNNRNPASEETAECRGFFERQLEIIHPEFICCLGAVAAQALLQTTVAVGRLRGRLHDYQGAKVVVTYHPSYLLRNPAAKKETWKDIQMLMKEMGLPLQKK